MRLVKTTPDELKRSDVVIPNKILPKKCGKKKTSFCIQLSPAVISFPQLFSSFHSPSFFPPDRYQHLTMPFFTVMIKSLHPSIPFQMRPQITSNADSQTSNSSLTTETGDQMIGEQEYNDKSATFKPQEQSQPMVRGDGEGGEGECVVVPRSCEEITHK